MPKAVVISRITLYRYLNIFQGVILNKFHFFSNFIEYLALILRISYPFLQFALQNPAFR